MFRLLAFFHEPSAFPTREKRLVGAQAVALLQVGNGEIDVAIVDQQRGELERLRQGVKVEFHTVLEGPKDGARGMFRLPPPKMCPNF